METKVTAAKWSIDQDGTWLHLLCEGGQKVRAWAEGADKPHRLKLTEWREKRSLSANSYAWTLLNKLSAALHLPPEEIYRNLIPDVGDNNVTVLIDPRAVKHFRETWEAQGVGWVTKTLGAYRGMIEVMAYYGSSTYDTAQMSRLLELIIAECKAQNIEYLPPDKLAAMLEDWDNAQTDKSPGDTQSG